ncbi:arsenate-mycothiol transferase ArsC [Kocuria soli]|uniref:arsenate-mycothiol transferase ArsC n=1 Tax=Kocuria soli TaxID=2485125 RepID=UPI001315A014|nr:low molecular weight phosphatase family protein [Kocuria soli]
MTEILVVCTGNICRSPFAALYLADRLDRMAPGEFTVSSAGTFGLDGAPMDPRAARRLGSQGVDAATFRARSLDDASTAAADVVLTMTGEQRSEVVSRSPSLLKRAFTMREFAQLLENLLGATDAPQGRLRESIPRGQGDKAEERWRMLPRTLSSLRAVTTVPEPDVTDPYGRDDAAFDVMVDQLMPALRTILDAERAWRD